MAKLGNSPRTNPELGSNHHIQPGKFSPRPMKIYFSQNVELGGDERCPLHQFQPTIQTGTDPTTCRIVY